MLPGDHVAWHVASMNEGQGFTLDTARQVTGWLVAAVRRRAPDASLAAPSEEDLAIEHLDEARRSNADALAGLPSAAATKGGKVWVMGGGNMFLRVDRTVASGVLEEAQARLAEDAMAAAVFTLGASPGVSLGGSAAKG